MRRHLLAMIVAGCGRIGFDGLASTDAGGDTPDAPDAPSVVPSKCGQITAMICDGFEQGVFDTRWTLSLTAGTADLDMSRAYRGGSSVHFHTNASNVGTSPGALLRTSQGFGGAITGTVYLRAWVYVASPFPTTVFAQMLNVVDGATTGVSMGSRNAFVRSNDYKFQQSSISATVMFPLDRWACVQLEVPSNIEGATRVFVDGSEVTDIALNTPVGMAQPAADHVYVGLDWVTTTVALPATDAWFDELVIDTQPTTCAQ